ncbi:MAG: A/G-specific adenine glycosylase [Eubacterium sp.]|nr:A/G-specific adenine glycosylase [Eubacterium sp.]
MIRPVTGRKAVRLPSTSPANAAWSADRLVRAWDAVREPLGVLPAECGQVLLSWYDRNRRILPWREAPSAYHVWISEIMLQQTRVEAVKKYYDRWIRRLPDPAALAAVEDEELMKLWEGLGYYNRARNLKKAAISVMEDWGGALPGDYENLKSLPGIGDYTAGAIASIAFGIRVPAVDGNAIRIVSRMLAEEREIDRESVKREIRERIFRIMPKERPGDFNQALMDLGASVCLPGGRPLCESCPWESKCISARRGSQDKYPVRKKKKERKKEDLTVFLIIIKNRVCLHKRPSTGLLADMWEFPNLAGNCPPDAAADYADKVLGLSDYRLESAGKGRHVFTHVEWQMRGYRIRADHLPERVIREKDLVLVTEEELQSTYAVPSAFETFKKELLDKEPAGSGQT